MLSLFKRDLNFRRASMMFALTLALGGCGKDDDAKPSTAAEHSAKVQVTHVTKKTLSRMDQLPGEIRAFQDVAIYPKVPSFIKWIGVDRGSKVKKGQVMVELTAPELAAQKNEALSKSLAAEGQLSEAQAKVASARATLREAEAQFAGDNDTYQRTNDASKVPGVVAPNDLVVLRDKVAADKEKVSAWKENLQAAKDQVVSAKNMLAASKKSTSYYNQFEDYLTITAPFDGYVTERNLHVGSFVGPRGQGAYPSIVTVQELDLLRIIAPVPEVDVGGVVPGAKVSFTVSTHPGENFEGTVARLGNYLEKRTRTMPVELNYPNPGWRILPGMFCEIHWPTRRKSESLFVPVTAVDTTSTLEMFVQKIDQNDEVVWVPVKRGEIMGKMTEVFGDLHDGDRIALQADDGLRPKTKVEPVESQADDADQKKISAH
ncbi:MAG TPA: efflux RND transporter periplasmic adaptor subunit [Drouetiella sp.]